MFFFITKLQEALLIENEKYAPGNILQFSLCAINNLYVTTGVKNCSVTNMLLF